MQGKELSSKRLWDRSPRVTAEKDQMRLGWSRCGAVQCRVLLPVGPPEELMHVFQDQFGTCHTEIITRDSEDWAMEELFLSVS